MTTLIDTGPLVALIDRRDEHHGWAVREANKLDPPFCTCEAVLTEAHFLLSGVPGGNESLHRIIERDRFNLRFSFREHRQRVIELMRIYRDQPMSLADACMVRLSELHRRSQIFTTDDDFQVYRKRGDETIDLILAPA